MEKQAEDLSFLDTIVSIALEGQEDCACISVSGEDRRYVTGDGLITHNTQGDPRDPLPPAYITPDGQVKILGNVPPEYRSQAILDAQVLDPGPPRSLADIFRPASPEVRRNANRIAAEMMADRYSAPAESLELRSQPITGSDYSNEELGPRNESLLSRILASLQLFAFNGHKADIDDEFSATLTAAINKSDWIADLTAGAGIHTVATFLARKRKKPTEGQTRGEIEKPIEKYYINEFAPIRAMFWDQLSKNPKAVIAKAKELYKGISDADRDAHINWKQNLKNRDGRTEDQARHDGRVKFLEDQMVKLVLPEDFNPDKYSDQSDAPVQQTPEAAAWNLVAQNWSSSTSTAISVELQIIPRKLEGVSFDPKTNKARKRKINVAGNATFDLEGETRNPFIGDEYELKHSITATGEPTQRRTNESIDGISLEAEERLMEVAEMIKGASVTQGDAWERIIPLAKEAQKAGKRLLAYIDPPYWAASANYSKGVANNADLSSLIKYTRNQLAEANRLGAKVMFTNDWALELRDELQNAGFYVYGGTRDAARQGKPEVVAFNWNVNTGEHEERPAGFNPSESGSKFLFGRGRGPENAPKRKGSDISLDDNGPVRRKGKNPTETPATPPEVRSSEESPPPGLVEQEAEPDPLYEAPPRSEETVVLGGKAGNLDKFKQEIKDAVNQSSLGGKGVKILSQGTNRIEELTQWAQRETEQGGEQTTGDPTLSHGMDNHIYRGADAYYREKYHKQHEEDWIKEAELMLARDYDGVVEGLLAKFAANETLTPSQTKAAEIIIAQEMGRAMNNGQANLVQTLIIGLRHSRGQTARTLAAFRDPHKTPAERWRAFLGEIVFTPKRSSQKKIDAAPHKAHLEDQIEQLKKKLATMTDAAKRNASDAEQARALQVRIAELESTPTKESFIEGESAQTLARVKALLKKIGVTIDDLQNGVTEVKLKGSALLDIVSQKFTPQEIQIVGLMQMGRGGNSTEVAARIGIKESEVSEIYERFTNSLKEQVKIRLKRGINADQLDMENTTLPAQADEEESGISENELNEEADRVLRMMGLSPTTEGQNHTTYRKKGAKRTKKKITSKTPVNMPEWTRPTGPGLPMETVMAEAKVKHMEWGRPTGEGKPVDTLLEKAKKQKEWERPTGEGKNRDGGFDFSNDRESGVWEGVRFDPEDIGQTIPVTRMLQIAARGTTGWDYANEIVIAGMLSGISTTFTNMSGTFYAVYKSVFMRAMESSVNAMMKNNPDLATFGEFKPLFRALSSNFARALSNAVIAFKTESPVTERLRFHMQGDFMNGSLDETMGHIPGLTGKIIRLPLAGLMAYDEFLKTIVSQTHAATLAYRLGNARGLTGDKMELFIDSELSDPRSYVWEAALDEARHQTFQTKLRSFDESNATYKAGKTTRAQQILDLPENFIAKMQSIKTAPAVDAGIVMHTATFLVRMTLPFLKTPFNLFKIGVGMTPLRIAYELLATDNLRKNAGRRLPTAQRTALGEAKKNISTLTRDLRAARNAESRARVQKELDAANRSKAEAEDALKDDPLNGWLQAPTNPNIKMAAQSAALASAINILILALGAEGDEDDDEKMFLWSGSRETAADSSRGATQTSYRTMPPTSIRIGGPGGWVWDYSRIDPFSTLIAITVDGIKEAKRAWRTGLAPRASRVMNSLFRQFTDRANTQGISNLISTATGAKEFGLPELASTIGQRMSPNIIRSILRNNDGFYRDTDAFGNDFLSVLAYSALPTTSLAPEAKRDTWGRKRARLGGEISRDMIPGAPYHQAPYSAADQTLRAFALQHPELKDQAPASMSLRGTMRSYEISASAAALLIQTRGEILLRMMGEELLLGLTKPTVGQVDKIMKLPGRALYEAKKRLGIGQ